MTLDISYNVCLLQVRLFAIDSVVDQSCRLCHLGYGAEAMAHHEDSGLQMEGDLERISFLPDSDGSKSPNTYYYI